MTIERSVSSAASTVASEYPILSVTIDGLKTALNVNLPVSLGVILVMLAIFFLIKLAWGGLKGFHAEEITIKDPLTGMEVKIKASYEDKKVAHKIWTELVTRKAALPFQRDKDLIIEVYDSWYALFQCVREQIAAIPIEKLQGREKTDIEKLVDISTRVLNEGLRPHLTEWQAKFRAWYDIARENEKCRSPQDIQREFPQYDQLVSSIEEVNKNLNAFACELKKIVRT